MSVSLVTIIKYACLCVCVSLCLIFFYVCILRKTMKTACFILWPHQNYFLFPVAKVEEDRVGRSVQFFFGLKILAIGQYFFFFLLFTVYY